MRKIRDSVREDLRDPDLLVVIALLIFLLTLVGPFGTYAKLDLGARFLFWTPVALAGVFASLLIGAYVYRVRDMADFRRGAIISAIAAMVLVTMPLHAVIALVLGNPFPDWQVAGEVALLVGSTTLGGCALQLARGKEGVFAQPRPDPPHRLDRRLPQTVQAPILLVSGRDHYVDVTTQKGRISLLMRFSDALSEVDPQAGTQIHRSHWAAFEAMAGLEKEGNRLMLLLTTGERVPVSRNHLAKVEAALAPAERRQGAA